MSKSIATDVRELVTMFHEYKDDCKKRPDGAEGARAFEFCAIALEELLRRQGLHIGKTINGECHKTGLFKR